MRGSRVAFEKDDSAGDPQLRRRAARTAEQANERDAEPLLQERIQHRIDGGVEPQQPENDLQREVGDAEVADGMDESAYLVRRPREEKDHDEDGQ